MEKERKEREIFYEWGCKYHSKKIKDEIFPPIDENKDSYFVKREKQDCYLQEYGFQSLPQLQTEILKIWKYEEPMGAIIKPVLVSAFKNRIGINVKNKGNITDENDKSDELPQYIYNF